jgi:hypothetical protein
MTVMPQITLDVDLEEIKELVLQLPPQQLLALIDAMEERAETIGMMVLAETGFAEWNEEGEDIYDAET